jgi:hypothetical protein
MNHHEWSEKCQVRKTLGSNHEHGKIPRSEPQIQEKITKGWESLLNPTSKRKQISYKIT